MEAYNNIIAPILTNFVPNQYNDTFIYYKLSDEYVEVLYYNMALLNVRSDIRFTFSVKIYPSGKIEIHYYRVYSIDKIKSYGISLPNYLKDNYKYKIFIPGLIVDKNSDLSFKTNTYSSSITIIYIYIIL